MNKQVITKVRELNDKNLTKIIEVFDGCLECWKPNPEKCELQPIRKKIGLQKCRNAKIKIKYKNEINTYERARRKRVKKQNKRREMRRRNDF